MEITEIQVENNWGLLKKTERIKSEFFRDSIYLANSQSKISKMEKNDCVVRAFMVALDISYNQAHAWVRKYFHRIDKKGTYTSAYANNVINLVKNGLKISFIGAHPSKSSYFSHINSSTTKKVLVNKQYKNPTGFTLKSFMEAHPTGRFMLVVQEHAIAVVDGVMYGNENDQTHGLYRSVWYGFKMQAK